MADLLTRSARSTSFLARGEKHLEAYLNWRRGRKDDHVTYYIQTLGIRASTRRSVVAAMRYAARMVDNKEVLTSLSSARTAAFLKGSEMAEGRSLPKGAPVMEEHLIKAVMKDKSIRKEIRTVVALASLLGARAA